MGISHSFDVDIAKMYGVNAAILLKYVGHWIDKNKANGKHFYDGKYWTYNSVKAFKDLFPYMSEKVIRNTLQKLEDEGVIVTGNYNKVAYDRTTWYAFTEKGKSICLLGKMEVDERENGFEQKGEPIPDINTDKNTNNNSSVESVSREDINKVVDAWNTVGLAKVRKMLPNTDRYKSLQARIREYGIDDVMEAVEKVRKSGFLHGKNDKDWRADFEFFVAPNRFPRILEGKYDDGEKEYF